MLHNARVTAFTVTELLREHQQELPPPTPTPTQIRVMITKPLFSLYPRHYYLNNVNISNTQKLSFFQFLTHKKNISKICVPKSLEIIFVSGISFFKKIHC